MKKRIKRGLLIKAMREEPLLRGAFVHNIVFTSNGQLDYDLEADPKTCPVCAVGAIARRLFGNTVDTVDELDGIATNLIDNIHDITGDKQSIREALDNGAYTNALSSYFEGLKKSNFSKRTGLINQSGREKMVSFIKKNFPKTLVIHD